MTYKTKDSKTFYQAAIQSLVYGIIILFSIGLVAKCDILGKPLYGILNTIIPFMCKEHGKEHVHGHGLWSNIGKPPKKLCHTVYSFDIWSGFGWTIKDYIYYSANIFASLLVVLFFFYNLLLLFSRIGWIPCHNFIVLKPLRYNIFPIALPILNLMDVYNIITGLIQNSFLDYYYKFVKLVNVKYYGNYYK